MIRSDDAHKFLKNVRGSPAYFQRVMYEVLGMIRQLGLPTWFLTLSAADMQWPDVIQTIARQYGTILSDDDVKGMSFEDKSKWLRQNPVTAARHFHYRLQTFFQTFHKSRAQPIGELVDYAIRIEFQARGSPHAHTILWIKDSPKLDQDPDEGVCNPDDKCSPDEYSEAQHALTEVHKVLNSSEVSDDLTLEDVLEVAGVTMAANVRGLSMCSAGNAVIMQRQVSETWINTYNPDVLRVWRANMDIQFILDPYACVMYIASYMLKSERSMGKRQSTESSSCPLNN